MPLTRRLENEILPEWRIYSVQYKDLQREAEDLVGNDNEELDAVFKFHLLHAIEEASTFYEAKCAQVEEHFNVVAKQVDVCAQVHTDRAAKHPPCWTPSTSPTTSTDCLWAAWNSQMKMEDTSPPHELAPFFETWVRSTKEKRGVILLSDFVDDSFMSQLEEGALRGALKEWLRLLALIDQVRSFAVLNVLAVVKLAQRHCGAVMAADISATLHALPVFAMKEVGDLMTAMEDTAKRLALCLHKDYAWSMDLDSASHWSLHICPFCAKSVCNGVMLQPGRPACWTCTLAHSSNAIVSCPLTGRDVDVRSLKLERVLGTFLRRYFPSAHKTAPGTLLGNFVETVEAPVQRHGILSMLKSASTSRVPRVPEERSSSSSSSLASPKRGRKKGPAVPAMDLSYLDAAVTKMLERLGEGAADIDTPCSSAGSRASGGYLGGASGSGASSLWDRRDRSTSLPCPPRGYGEQSMNKSSSQSCKAKPSGAPKHRAAAVRDLASLVT